MNTILKFSFRFWLLFALVSLVLPSCDKGDDSLPDQADLVKNEDASVPLAWMKLYLKLDRYTQDFRQGPSARALAYINLAAYESVMVGMPEYKSLNTLYAGLSIPAPDNGELHYPTVVNTVYANLFKRLVPNGYFLPSHQSELQFDILALETEFNDRYKPMVGADIHDRSIAHGNTVAEAVWEWSKADPFGHEAYANARPDGYVPPLRAWPLATNTP